MKPSGPACATTGASIRSRTAATRKNREEAKRRDVTRQSRMAYPPPSGPFAAPYLLRLGAENRTPVEACQPFLFFTNVFPLGKWFPHCRVGLTSGAL
jgi:hypothetical protein